ncbi:unnamed protein product, partial [Owenia fusiformis]
VEISWRSSCFSNFQKSPKNPLSMWKSESGTMTDNNNTNSYRSFEEDEDFALGQDIPVDSTARVGTDVTFNCKDQGYSYVQWVEYASQGDTGVTVWHTGGQVSNPAKYEVDSTSANKYTLTIKNVQLTDVGKYECRTIPSAGPPKDYAAQLTVIPVAQPECCSSNKSSADGAPM